MQLSMEDREAVRDMFGQHAAEHIVLAVCMMGFLNKMMDTTGIDMEAAPVREVGELLRSTGYWSTGKFAVADADSYLQVRRCACGACRPPCTSVLYLPTGGCLRGDASDLFACCCTSLAT